MTVNIIENVEKHKEKIPLCDNIVLHKEKHVITIFIVILSNSITCPFL